jgi:hypothetical protein
MWVAKENPEREMRIEELFSFANTTKFERGSLQSHDHRGPLD